MDPAMLFHALRLLTLICLFTLGPLATDEPSDGAPDDQAEAEDEQRDQDIPVDPEVIRMRTEIERLRVTNELHSARLAAALQELRAERERIETELALAEQRRRHDAAALMAEKERLEQQSQIEEVRHQASLREVRQRLERLAATTAEREQNLAAIQLDMQEEGLNRQRAMTAFQFTKQQQEMQLELALHETRAVTAQTEIAAARLAARSLISEPSPRPQQPLVDGVLTVSDRRININEPIIVGMGSWFERRIAFFNNASEHEPIFVVIDYCPGGSMMEGERMLKAMTASRAPVHVVVKSMAASMAAVLLSEAPHSYALPNAIILHHQPWSFAFGNLAEQKEWVAVFEQWAERLHGGTARRMGLTLEQFYARMYEHSVTGDWQEFGDNAQALSWVQHVIEQVQEDDVRQQPDDASPWRQRGRLWAHSDEERGERLRLPRPRPFDFYFLYNRDRRFFIGE